MDRETPTSITAELENDEVAQRRERERESSLPEQLTQEEEESILKMYRKFVTFLKSHYGEDIFDPIDAVRFKEELKTVYLEHKYRPGNEYNRISSYQHEALLRFVSRYYADILSLKRVKGPNETRKFTTQQEFDDYYKKRDLGQEFVENCIRMIPILRKQHEEEPLGE